MDEQDLTIMALDICLDIVALSTVVSSVGHRVVASVLNTDGSILYCQWTDVLLTKPRTPRHHQYAMSQQ